MSARTQRAPATDSSGMLSGAPKRFYDPRIGMYTVRET